jgi:type II secretory pathway pseudopilin PulG
MKRLILLLSLAAVVAWATAQMTPTERLNEQRRQQLMAQQQAQQQAAQEAARRVTTRRLNAPCVIPDSYYPFRTCK